MKKFFITILIISTFALAAALTAEFGFHINPCILCLAQRVPFAFAILLALIGILQPRVRKGILIILTALFLMNAGIAGYQVGIENGVWGLDDKGNGQVCTAPNLAVDNIKELYQSMSGTPVGDCAHPAFNFHGITFAVMNALLSLGLMFIAARQFFKRQAR